ncbi:galactoside alpha-(1,2)-fucosyltransferase 2-like isoform X1 [Haliotis rufescens]|uniref:galactoside alpha-(1,2)-fucosyltransferase 2-like isoform X1 n=3 Tax=Haliotis rufescens TaxID=6454 RepID=UPI00201F7C8E|nr:galactoside alpha-(1,2)-fucosyltransferase 2-like isoform X1 [Haliotis rufescens]
MGEYRRRRETVFVLDVCEQRSISGHDDTRSTKPPNLTIRLTNNDQRTAEKFLGCCDLLEVKRVCQMACQDAIWKRALKRGRKLEYMALFGIAATAVYIFSQKYDVLEGGSSSKQTTSEQTGTRIPTQNGNKRTWNSISENRHKHFVICIESGRLGNAMFTYASIYGIASRKNMSVVIDESNPLVKHFKLDAKIMKIQSLSGYLKLVEKSSCDFDQTLTKFDPIRNVMIERYLQSWLYFSHVQNKIRSQFDFTDSTKASADGILNRIREERSLSANASATLVGIHYRRGDYELKHFKDFGYQLAPVEYIQRAMEYFRLRYSHVTFVLATTSADFVKDLLKDGDVIHVTGGTAIVDMAIMARCDHLIQTVGTYGWWSGFLNRGTVVYYKYPAREGSDFRKMFSSDYSSFFYPKWIGME